MIDTQERESVRLGGAQELGPEQLPVNLPVLLGVLLRCRQTIALWGASGFLAALVLALLLPVQYTGVASFIPPGANNTSSAAALMGQLSLLSGSSGLGMLGGKGQGDLYVGILKSHVMAAKLSEQFNLQTVYGVKKESTAEKKLAQRSIFETGSKDPIVTISVTDRSPTRAAALANGYLQALQATTANLALTESSQRRLFFEQRLAKEKDDLANAEIALKQSEEKSGLIAPAGQTASEIQALAQLHAQITDRQTRVAALLHDETADNPDVIRLRSEVGSLQGRVAQLESGKGKDHFGGFSAAQVPELQLEYIRRTREVKYHEALFEIIAKQYEAARLDEARDSPLQVLDRAITPDTKSGPPRTLITAVGLVMGLLGGSAWVIFQVARKNGVHG